MSVWLPKGTPPETIRELARMGIDVLIHPADKPAVDALAAQESAEHAGRSEDTP